MKGTYCLIIELKRDNQIKIGKLGEIDFKKGFYVYVGSALNSLEGRVKRHLSSNKKTFWHVDYLLKHPDCEIRDVMVVINPEKIECSLASLILKESQPLPGFGCSDCKCPSHLFYFFKIRDAVDCVSNSFKKLKLDPHHWNDLKNDLN